MNDKIQIIERDGQPEWAVLPYETYLKLIEEAEMLQDIQDYDAVKLAIERAESEVVPAEVTFALLDGQNPVKVWREYRGYTQHQLAEASGISPAYLSQIEKNRRAGTRNVWLAIAGALHVSVDEILLQIEK